MKERIKEIGYVIEGKIKDLCGEITPDKRLIIILTILLICTIVNLYITFSAIYNMGKQSRRKESLKIEHIEQPELKKHPPYKTDMWKPQEDQGDE